MELKDVTDVNVLILIAISEEVKLCLLELLCFFNCEEQLAEELIEERWFSRSTDSRKILKKTWKYVLCGSIDF